MNPYSATFPKKLSYLCLLVAFCFGAFLFDPTNRPLKYTLLGIALLSTISSLTQQGFSSSFKSYSQFIFPWLPWFFCVFVVIAVHGGENFYFDSFLILSLLFFSLRDITIKRNWVNCAIAVTGALVSFAVIWEVINLKHLPAEIYQVNKNVLMSGVSLLMTCSIASLLFDFRHNRIAINILLAISITASLICIVLTEVRTALLAILALIPLTFFYNKQNPWKYIFILFSISLVMLALFWYTGRLQEGIADLEKFQSGNSNSSWGIRLELWKLSLDAFFSKPVFGWGVQPFKEIIQSGFTFPVSTFHPRHFHSDFFNMLVCIGLVGVLGWLSTIVLLIKNSWKDPTSTAMLFACLAMGLTERLWFQNRVSIYMMSTLWVLLYLSKSIREQTDSK